MQVSRWVLVLLMCPLWLMAEEGAEARAQKLADEVVTALGGRDAYDQTRYLTWRFFGRRFHVWDKHSGDIRVEDGKGLVVIMNLNTKQGKAWQNDEALADDALAEALDKARKAWINDAYWVVMPYKLHDPGVNLAYVREDKTEDGVECDVINLTFNEVGVTPDNRYEVYIDKASKRVVWWNYFPKADDKEPRMSTPWAGWEWHGDIMLPNNFGRFQHSDLAVLEKIPAHTFTSPKPLPPLRRTGALR